MNECGSNPCQNDAECIDGDGTYTCTCTTGWGGHNCDESKLKSRFTIVHYSLLYVPNNLNESCYILFLDIDECTLSTHNCAQRCTDTDGSFDCSCETGLTLDDDGFSCTSGW